jgi:hypothetical protein
MSEPIIVTDARGRKIQLRALDPADTLDLLEAAENASSNRGWITYAMVMASVEEIDGVPVPRASTKAQIKDIGRQLGNDGFSACAKVLFPEDKIAAPSAEQERDAVKN